MERRKKEKRKRKCKRKNQYIAFIDRKRIRNHPAARYQHVNAGNYVKIAIKFPTNHEFVPTLA